MPANMGFAARGKPVQQQGIVGAGGGGGGGAGVAMPPLRNRHCLSASLLLTIIMSFVVSHRLLTTYLAETVIIRSTVSKEKLLNYSLINVADAAERLKMKGLLERSEGGRYSIKEVLFLKRPPPQQFAIGMDRNSAIRRRQTENAWMVPLTSRRFDPYVVTFYKMARNWLAEGDFDPRVMQDLVRTVKEPMDRRSRDAYLHTPAPSVHEVEGSLSAPSRYRSCAVVGNSGILLNSSYGALIDSHEMVIRLNNAKTQGFQKHVGSKTTLAFMNSNILRMCSRRPDCACHPYGEDVPIILYICQAPHLMDVALCGDVHKSPLVVTDGRLDSLCARIVKWYSVKNFVETSGLPVENWDSAHHSFYFHYSSGFQAVVVALGICDRVSMFGFGKHPLLKHHYHTDQRRELALHDYEAEYIFYDDLVHNRSIPFLSESGISIPPVTIYY